MTFLETRISDYYAQVDHSLGIHPARGTMLVDGARTQAITALFSPRAVYERDGWDMLEGDKAIGRFFARHRNLVGTHAVSSVEERAGIAPEVEARVKQHFAMLAPQDCRTVKVQGLFSGALCHADEGAARFVRGASGVEIPFVDHWVIEGEKVVYRYSKLELEPTVAAEMQQARRSAAGRH